MKKGVKIALFGALAASLVPFVVDVDDSDPKAKKTSVKSLLYSVNVTRTPAEEEDQADKTAVSVSFPGLIGELFAGKCKKQEEEIPEELVEELAEKISEAEDSEAEAEMEMEIEIVADSEEEA